MSKIIVEAVTTEYNPKTTLKTMQSYLSKMPKNAQTFIKVAVFKGQDAKLFNVSDVQVSKSLVDGTAAEDGNPVAVNIVFTKKADAKACTCRHFSDICKKIIESLKGVDEDQLTVAAMQEGKKEGGRFRFYYDDETSVVLLVKAANTATVEAFVKAHADEFKKAEKTKKPVDVKGDGKEKAAAKEPAKSTTDDEGIEEA